MTRPTQTPASNSTARKRLTLVPTPCCDAAAKVARVEELAAEWEHEPGCDSTRGDCCHTGQIRAALDGPAGGGGCA